MIQQMFSSVLPYHISQNIPEMEEDKSEIQSQMKNLDIAEHEKQTLNHYPQNNNPSDEEYDEQEQHQGSANSKWEKIEQPKELLPLYMVDFQQCDSKKCTGKKMERFKLLSTIKDRKKKFKGIVLSAFGKKLVSKEDLDYIQKYGICVIDCSWNKIEETREFRAKHQRKLPFVVAGNPVNFGKPYQLSCVEAMATALCAIGKVDQAKFIMSKFGWSDGFWKQNPRLQEYGECETVEQVKQMSRQIQQTISQVFQRNYEFSSEEDEEEEGQKGKQQ